MKATIIRPDGTRIEAEGTPEEVAKLAPPMVSQAVPACLCYYVSRLVGVWCPQHGYRAPFGPITYGAVYAYPAESGCAGSVTGVIDSTTIHAHNAETC